MDNYWTQLRQLESESSFDYKKWFNFYCSVEDLHTSVTYALKQVQLDLWCSNSFFDDADRNNPLSYGQCGENVYWKIIGNVLYIGGEGDMWDFNPDSLENDNPEKFTPPWSFSAYGPVIIQNGVTSIGKYAFYNGPIDSIMIPASICIIKEGAFSETAPRILEIPSTIQTIEPYIIADDPCHIGKLVLSINIPNIAPEAFYTRYLAPDEIVLTGTLPEDLSSLIRSNLFDFLCKKISYPQAWDNESDSFFDKLAQAIRIEGEEAGYPIYDKEDFDNLHKALTPYEVDSNEQSCVKA